LIRRLHEFDESGKLLDFVCIKPDSDIDRIEFHAPADGSSIFVATLGSNRSKEIPENVKVGSRVGHDFIGKVTVQVKKGTVIGIFGNTISHGNPFNAEALKAISESMPHNANTHPDTTSIVKNDHFKKALVEDSNGNLLPEKLTASEQEFVTLIVDSIKRKDMEALLPLIHKRNKPSNSNVDTTKDFLKYVLEQGMTHYRFVQIDKEHPDNQKVLKDHYSLPPEWILTIYSSPKDAPTQLSADIVIGTSDGKLMIPTLYGD